MRKVEVKRENETSKEPLPQRGYEGKRNNSPCLEKSFLQKKLEKRLEYLTTAIQVYSDKRYNLSNEEEVGLGFIYREYTFVKDLLTQNTINTQGLGI